MTIEDAHELLALQAAGKVVRGALDAMSAAVEPGVTTLELDQLGQRYCEDRGARSGPRLAYDFPGFSCISVNEEAVHGIPGPRRLEAGDLVKIDVTVELDGFYADACTTVGVPPVSDRAVKLIATAQAALAKGILRARAGKLINRIGKAVETEVNMRGAQVLRELGGHGIGRKLHDEPRVENWYVGSNDYRLPVGLVFTIEPIIAESTSEVYLADDGWTIKTRDGSLAAQFEHTVVITRGAPLLLTA